jgi:hypothetical protein
MPFITKHLTHLAISVAAAALMTACGGGGGSSSTTTTTSDTSSSSASSLAAVAAAQSSQYVVVTVTPTNDGTGISVSPALLKTDGSTVTTLNDLPEGIANSDWMKTTGTRLPLKVILGNGTYYLTKSWTWTPSQSGRSGSEVNIEAESTGGVIISGAKTVTVTKATHGGASKVTTNLSSTGITSFEQLWVNGARVVRARTPNVGDFYYVKNTVSNWGGASTIDSISVDRQAFKSESTALAYLSTLTTAEKAAAILVAAHSWTASQHHIAETNASNEVRVTPAAPWAFLKYGNYQRYFIENIPTALDAAGEWYFSPTTTVLSYMPTTAEKLADLVFDVPVQTQLLVVQGQVSASKWVEYLNFKGLTFRYAHMPLPAAGLTDQQSAVDIGAAVQFSGARYVALSNCEVSRVGGYGIWLKDNVRNATVSGCEVYDTGAGGIRVGLANQADTTTATAYNTVRANRIHATGYQFPGAVGIWLGQTPYNTVEDNLIGDTTYSGISVGWNWGYGTSLSHHNQINRNFLYDVMQGSLSDGAAIYTLGVSPGTEIKGNVIKDVSGFNNYGSGAWGIYNDEGSSNILIDSNIVAGSDHGGYMLHYGLNNVVSNNVFAGGRYAELRVVRSESTQQVTFSGNRLIPTLPSFIAYGDTSVSSPIVTYRNNQVSTQYVPLTGVPSYCGSGCSLSSAISLASSTTLAVPVVADGGSKVSLPNTLASSWTGATLTSVASPSKIWSKGRNFSFDAATADLGSNPIDLQIVPADHPELVSVILNSSGEKCLGFQDSAGLTNKWEPFALISTDYPTGVTTATFTLKADAATEFIHEWRDGMGYAGPSVTFSGSRGVVIKGTVVAPLPVGQWVTVTVTSTQGTSPTWQLSLKYADNTTRSITAQTPVIDSWIRTKAFYFISNASVASTPCIGKWSMSNTP